jgi:hypothetical protein
MKKYLFTDIDFEIIRLIKSKTPNKIWFNVIQYIIDYGDSYVKLEVKPTTDPSNYAIRHTYESTIGFSIVKETFTPCELSIQLCKNENITDIYIVRTLIYHDEYREPGKNEKKEFKSLLTSIRPESKDKFDTFLNQIDGIHNDFVVNPNSVLPDNIDPETTNLVDVGLLICLKNKFIKAFIEGNDDDFCNYDEKYIYDSIDFNDMDRQYELIKFE